MMVTLGVDAHKRTHTIVAVDANGARLASTTVKAASPGHLAALQWASQFPKRRWAVEDCRHVTRRLEADLLRAGEAVLRVPPKLMAQSRRSARTPGKSDAIDGLVIARVALREPDLPTAQLDGPAREVRLLVDYRETLVRQRVEFINRLQWCLHSLDPSHPIKAATYGRYKTLDRVLELLAGHSGVEADLARRQVEQIRQLTRQINDLFKEIEQRITALAPNLLAIVGCGPLTAAKLLGEVGDITRFRSANAFAMWAGVAPVPASSGNYLRHRLNRGGNRQANAALHRISITQVRHSPQAQAFMQRQTDQGKNDRYARRCHKRRIADAVYKALHQDAHLLQPPQQQAA